jgi:ketosteroid isomerase-like protein
VLGGITMSETLAVGKKLVELCKEGKHIEAIDALYHPNIVSMEAGAPPGGSARADGIAAVKGKGEWWVANHEVHGGDVEGPFPHGDRFIVRFKYDVTAKAGPMAGKRFTMDEAALYTVKDGKITHEEFFYSMG